MVFGDLPALLDKREPQVVILLRSGVTKVTDVARIMGYSNHSPISKKLKHIREQAPDSSMSIEARPDRLGSSQLRPTSAVRLLNRYFADPPRTPRP